MNRQVKMQIADSDLERFAREGATSIIVAERQNHAQMDRQLPGILAAAIRRLRANGHANGHAPKMVAAAAPAETETKRSRGRRRRLSAEARKKISDAQKRRWAKQKKSA